jgi:ATP-binding cassette, subfamily B, bacterial
MPLRLFILNLRRAIALVWRSSPRWTAISLVLLLVQGLLPLASLYLLKQLIDAVTLSLRVKTTDSWQQILILIGLTALISLTNDSCSALATMAQSAQSEVVSDRVHTLLHAKSIQVDLEYYENADYHNTFHRAQEEAAYRPPLILQGLIQVAQNSLALASILVLLGALNWLIPVLLLAAMLPGIWMRMNASGKRYWRLRNWTDHERLAYYFHTLLTQGNHAKEVRLYHSGQLFSSRFQKLRQSIYHEKQKLAYYQAQTDLLTQGGATIAVFAACGVIAFQTWQGMLTLGSFVMYYQAFQRGQAFLRDLLSNLVSLYENSLFLKDFYEFLDLEIRIASPIQPLPIPHPWQTGLEFREVSFDYPNSQRCVLKALSFIIAPGETVALVGENGAGKTTLIKLLCRLYDPTAGHITLDGIDLRHFDPLAWRNQISVLFQDYGRYQLTAAENIGLGDIYHAAAEGKVQAAACAAGADRVVQQLPAGYNTQLGTEFVTGEELSIGQWQKIALARGFMRDAPLIILDEPTSALDAKAEAEVFKRFQQMCLQKTAILISHRLSTIKMADRILVLAQGCLVENGTHVELMGQNGLYANLFKTQAKPYHL